MKVWKNGYLEEGYWENGVLHGKGQYIKSSGEYFIGEFEKGSRKSGKCRFANGNIYSGEWLNNKMDGEGTMDYSNGDKFVGTWKEDETFSGEYHIPNFSW